MADTNATIDGLLAALQTPLEAAGLADAFAFYDGDPAEAIYEHVAELQGEAGASVLVGFLSDADLIENASRAAIGSTLHLSVSVVRRRGSSGEQHADARALNDLYDAAIEALVAAPGIVLRPTRALVGDVDWFGRLIPIHTSRPL